PFPCWLLFRNMEIGRLLRHHHWGRPRRILRFYWYREDISASLRANGSRECAPDDRLSEAIHASIGKKEWIASSQVLLAMTGREPGLRPQHILLHLAAVEMEEWHRRVVAQRAGGRGCHLCE